MVNSKWEGAWQNKKACLWCGQKLGNKIGDTDKYHELCLQQKEAANG